MVQEIAAESDIFLAAMQHQGLYHHDNLMEPELSKDILKRVSTEIAGKYSIIPICEDKDCLVLVTSNFDAFKDQARIQKELQCPIKLLLTDSDNIKNSLEHYYHIDITKYSTVKVDSAVDTTPLKRLVNSMLQEAAKTGTSDIHMLPHENGMYIYFRIHGHLIDMTNTFQVKTEQVINIINIIKSMDTSGSADAAKSIIANKGSFMFTHGNSIIDVRLSTLPLAEGSQKIVLRLLPKDKKRVRLPQLGYAQKDLQELRKNLYKSASGIFICSGPTGSGKTTSIYAQILEMIEMNGEPLNVLTIESPVEIHEPQFCQARVHEVHGREDISMSPQRIFEVGLRQDPDIIYYGEIREENDARIAVTAAETGHRVFTTVHAKDCISTITRLLTLGVSRYSLLAELNLIISQRLIGVLCPHCSTEHELTEMELSVLTEEEIQRLKAPDVILRERGSAKEISNCLHCDDGFSQRIAILEYVSFDMNLRDSLLEEKVSFQTIRDILRKRGYRSMWEKGMLMVLRGKTELKEILHVIGKE